jgi:hypothetical protein
MSEATTIDTLQIEIQTSSTNASVGIRDLAKALSELKANGTIGVATKNLKALSDALRGFTDASNVTRSLGKLSGAMERLKSIGSVTGIANSIKKLSENLKGIDNINIDSVAPQIERIAGALAPLSAVKAGGISTMMNGLKKLGEVTKSLDEEAIGAFTQKVQRLSEVLTPLSEKMTTIQGGFRGINSAIRQTNVSVQQANAEVNVSVFNLSNMINVIQGAIQALNVVIQKLTETIGMAIEWDGIAARFGRGFGAQAEETYAWIQRLNEEMGINVQQFMQYSSVYATMLTGFGVAMEDAGKMALGYTELTYDIWAGYNDVYKNFSDAAEAVKSAIAGEVEPIRRAGFTIVESTLEQTAANHGLSISIEKATEAQKSYLRYLTLVDQANSQGLVGTYAKELQTAEGLVRTLTQQMNSLKQAFGSLFLPILVQVIPWLQAFVDLLTEAVHIIAGFFGFEIQKVDWSGYGDGAGAIGGVADSANTATDALDSATKAAKELKNATLGIDELNVISPPTASSSSGGSGGGSGFDGLDVDSLWDESIFDNIQSQVDEIKEKIKDMLPVVTALGVALAGLGVAKLLTDIDNAALKIKGLSKGLTVASIAIAVGALVWDFTGAYLEDGNWASFFSALGTTTIGAGLAYKFAGKGGLGFTLMVSGVAMLGRLAFDLSEGTVDFGDPQTWITLVTGSFEAVVGGIISWKVLGPIIKKAIGGLFTSAAFASIGTTISEGAGALIAALGSIPVWGWIAAAVVALIAGAIALAVTDYDFTEIGEKVGEALGWVIKNLTPLGWAISIGMWLYDAVKGAIDWFKQQDFDSFADFAATMLDKLLEGLKNVGDWFEDLNAAGQDIAQGIVYGIEDGWDNLIENLGEFFTGFWKGICKAFGISSPAEKTKPAGRYIVEGIWEGISGAVEWIKEKVSGWASDLIDDITNAMKPSAISEKLSAMWTNAKNWWNNSKVALSTYTPSIGDIKAKLSSAWTSAKDWWNKSKGTLATYTPSIGKIWEKLKAAWTSAKDWWNKSRSSLSYTPSIGSIKTKLSSAWSSAKDWWNKHKGSMSYTPSIGSIKSKLQSAWSTAKSWWNSNVKLSIPSLSFKVSYTNKGLNTAQKAIVKALGLSGWPSLKFAAAGGVFDQGSLVWAGERGPEVLANAGGGRTGVMNVQQMQDAVYEGVYAAVVAAMGAMGGNSGSQPVNVYLDGKQITAAVERRQRERGASILGNQVYSY